MKFIIIAISILISATILVVVINPPMHKEVQLVVTDFNFSESKTVNTSQNIAIEPKKNTVSSQKVEVNTADTIKNVSNIKTTSTQTQQKNIDIKPVTAQKKQVKTTVKPVNNTSNVNKTIVTPKTQPQTTTVKQPVSVPTKTVPTTAKTPTVKPVQTTTTKPPAVDKTQEIVWNQWKANVHNNIIAKVQLPKSKIPNGTVFQYSFTVSDDGNITNIRTTSEAPQYTAYAIQYIAPAIRNSQHASFLKFPSGTQRTSVNVSYKFKITDSAGSMASASNFNDVEIIKK